MARTAIPARSLAICEVSTSCTEDRRGFRPAWQRSSRRGTACGMPRSCLFAAPCRHQFAAAALDSADHAVDVVVTHAADGKLDVILRRIFGLHGHDGIFNRRAPRRRRGPLRSRADQAIMPPPIPNNPACSQKFAPLSQNHFISPPLSSPDRCPFRRSDFRHGRTDGEFRFMDPRRSRCTCANPS